MQSELDWINTDVSEKEAYAYYMRVDPGMRDFLGPIETIDDLLTERSMKVRKAKVAVLRSGALSEVTVYLEPWPHIRLDNPKELQGWYSSRGDGLLQGQRDRPCETDAILTQPYGGWCNVGCLFCYINSGTRGYRGSGLISVPPNYGDFVKKRLAQMQVAAAGYFSSFTEPFIDLEPLYHNTQRGAEAFVEAGLPIFFLSRRIYPEWAIDLLRKNPFSYAQKSLNTPHEADWAKLSPNSATLAEHLEDLRRIHAAGIYISIQVNPIIPGVMSHDDVEQLFGMLASAGVDHVIVKFVEANSPWAPTMIQRVAKKFPDRVARFEELFQERSCGSQRTILEDYRREGHGLYQKWATALGMTYSLCYEYTNTTRNNPKAAKKVWKSMGPEFLTSDQCHGHRVPMHVKQDGRFVPLEVCPPSGCLRCEDHGCGSELLSSAKALRMPDLKKPYDGKLPLGVIQ
jgi:DNA repair photolyase